MKNVDKLMKLPPVAILGGLSIVFGTVLSNNMNHPILSPLMFSLGIIFVIVLNLGLITRSVPSGGSVGECVIIALYNLFTAFLCGIFLGGFGNFPTTVEPNFWGAVGTGIIIGLVSLVNREETPYKVPVTIMLMFSFVYLKLPHCVVSAFYAGNILSTTKDLSALWGLFMVLIGNVAGGCVVRFADLWRKKEIGEKK